MPLREVPGPNDRRDRRGVLRMREMERLKPPHLAPAYRSATNGNTVTPLEWGTVMACTHDMTYWNLRWAVDRFGARRW